MTIEDRNLKPGTRLVARHKQQEHTCIVTETEDGIRYELQDGRWFKSVSSAGSAAMGGTACNGWRFWSVEGQEPPKKEPRKGGRKKKANPDNGLIERMEDGRYFCSTCMEAFEVPEGVEPRGCPKGHRPE